MANTNKQNNTNYYEIMYNLKLFWQEAKELKSIAEWEIFNAKFLQYIFSVTDLKETYTAGVNTFLNKDLKEARKEFYNNFSSKFLCADIDYSLQNSYLRILYFEVPNYTQQNIDLNREYYNIVDLYLKNCDKEIDFELIKKYTDIIETIDYFILSYLSNEPLFFSDDIVFSKLYLKAVFNGVYNHLKGAIICKISNEYYKDRNAELIPEPKKKVAEILELFSNAERCKEVFTKIYQRKKVAAIAQELKISENGVRSAINQICTKLKLEQLGINSLRQYIYENVA